MILQQFQGQLKHGFQLLGQFPAVYEYVQSKNTIQNISLHLTISVQNFYACYI